jgi:hypothetical protein
MYKLALAFVSLFFLIAIPAAATGSPQSNWVVTQLSGDARVVHPGAQPASLKVNNLLAAGDMLLTGPTGRATLVRGGDYIIVAPRSKLRVPATPQPAGFTRVIQNLGTLLFKVQHTGIPHFAVDTPMLAAVVKGTTFTVVVDGKRSAVQVIQGVVQVSTIDGAMSRMVEGGRTVFVNHDHPRMLLDADKPAPATQSPSSTSVTVSAAVGDSPLATIASLTGGLVRADLTSPTPVVASPIVVPQTAIVGSSAPNESAPAAAAPNPSTSTTVVVATNTTGPTVTAPAVTPAVTVPATTAPTVSTPAVISPSVATSTVTAPSVTVPGTPTVTVPSVTTPAITTPVVTVPGLTTPAVTVPGVNIGSNSGPGSMNSGSGSMNSGPGSMNSGSGGIPSVTTPTVTVPSVTTPTVTVPSITTPTITTPLVTVPSVSTPTVTVPAVTTPTVTVPPVTTPTIPIVTTILQPVLNLLHL